LFIQINFARQATFAPAIFRITGHRQGACGGTFTAQKVEHYEMAGYGSVRAFAQLLGQEEAAQLLQTTLDEESKANELLNQIAETTVNAEAVMNTGMTESRSR
jgi:ferritin-like metal-binding protein YciE